MNFHAIESAKLYLYLFNRHFQGRVGILLRVLHIIMLNWRDSMIQVTVAQRLYILVTMSSAVGIWLAVIQITVTNVQIRAVLDIRNQVHDQGFHRVLLACCLLRSFLWPCFIISFHFNTTLKFQINKFIHETIHISRVLSQHIIFN